MSHEHDPDRVTVIEEAQRISWAAGIFRTRSGLAGRIGLSSQNAYCYGLIYTHTVDIARWTSNSRLAVSVDTDDLQQWARYCSRGYPQDFLVPFDDRYLPNNSDIGDLVLSETSRGIITIAGSLAEVKDRWNVRRLSLQGVTEAGNLFSLATGIGIAISTRPARAIDNASSASASPDSTDTSSSLPFLRLRCYMLCHCHNLSSISRALMQEWKSTSGWRDTHEHHPLSSHDCPGNYRRTSIQCTFGQREMLDVSNSVGTLQERIPRQETVMWGPEDWRLTAWTEPRHQGFFSLD